MACPIAERGWIGVDLDGTLAEYHGWPKDGSIGNPIPAMLIRVKSMVDRMLYQDDMAVRIFTARVCPIGKPTPNDCDEQHDRIKEWCREHIGIELPICYEKDFRMVALFDDRCETVEPNSGIVLRDQLAAAERERDEASKQLEFDRTQLADVMTAIQKALESRFWLTEGRGSYRWDDERFRQEFADAWIALQDAIAPLETIAANWSACPRKAEDVARARMNLMRERDEALRKLAAAEADSRRLREALRQVLDHLPQSVISDTFWDEDDGTIVYRNWYLAAKSAMEADRG